ncbi:unnamed protein product [Kluyveromyces dobzhanskii CBS 2104]|uniref:WGS project CCBQ000000000 data, contig 00046 n=1 Tax=Kluyveromyces dobzhanskii CBS 2104 TaxID=1427455 RepID=A0A0A8L9P8_9SACH|nr:unnamed protein product [Kluyveromyces dobzhanskii CBS 2104]
MRLNFASALLLLGAIDNVAARRVLHLDSLDLSESNNEKRDGLHVSGGMGPVVNIPKVDKREPKRLPLDIEKIAAGVNDALDKRDARRVGLNVESLADSEVDVKKREMRRPQYVLDISQGKIDDRVNLDSRMAVLQDVSLFSEYARDVTDVISQWEDTTQELLVIAPTNDAISKLSLKPWQFPNNIAQMEQENAAPKQIDDAIGENVAHFVKSHIVAHSNDFSAESHEIWLHSEADTSEKGDIVLKKENGEYYVCSASDMEFKLVKTVDVAANGVILIIESSLIAP